ncbi:glutamate receptor 4, partial [Caerostris darwini]
MDLLQGQTLLLLLLTTAVATSAYTVRIGVLNGPGSDRRLSNEKLWSFGRDQTSAVALEPAAYDIPYWNTLDIIKAVCRAAKEGCRALVFNGPPRLGPLLTSYSEHLNLPLVLDTPASSSGGSQVGVMPDTVAATAALIRHYQWDSFAFIYDTDHGPHHLQSILKSVGDSLPQVEAFWRAYSADEAAAFARRLPLSVPRLLLHISEESANRLLEQLSSYGRTFHAILITPVGVVRQRPTQGLSKLTKLSVVDMTSPLVKELENRWKTLEERARRPSDKDLPDAALVTHDASRVLHVLFDRLARDRPEMLVAPASRDCSNYTSDAVSSQQFQRNTLLGRGVTGSLQFDQQGRRSGYTLYVLESTPFSLNKIGTWSDLEGLKIGEKKPPVTAFQKGQIPLRVTSILQPPFLMQNENDTREGFVVDLLEQLTLVTGKKFRLQVVKDGRYGWLRSDGQWNGMIGELVNNETDMVLADLTKTSERAEVISFSTPFMTLGLNLLVSRPQDQPEGPVSFRPFAFLTVWPLELWMMVALAVVVFGVACYGASRWTGAPDRVRALESKGTDSLSPCGSLWFTVGALLQRDTGIYPRSITHRVWALLWWSFCFFVLVSYVSALTAALLETRTRVTTTYAQKTSQEVLEDLLQKGSPVIGTIRSGSSLQFFQNSNVGLYRDFGRYLKENPDAMSDTSNQAFQRVRSSKGSYAFVMESSKSEYYTNRPPCDTLATPGYFTTRVFAPALQKNSTLKEVIDHGILSLMESGTLRELYEKWWHNYVDQCEDPNMDILP